MMDSIKTYPLLQSQLGVFMECMRHPEVMQYNLPSYIRLDENVDLERLAAAVTALFNGRKELRLSFLIDENGQARQFVNPDLKMEVLRRKMSEKECLEYARHGFTRPFDILGQECLFRCEIIETENGPYILQDIHHLVCDGMTFTPIITTMDLPVAYAGEPLREIPYGMLEAAEDEQTSFGTSVYESDKQFYAEKLQGLDFATLSSESGDVVGKMIRESSFLPVSVIDGWCKENGIACNLLFQAAFSYVISVFLRQDTIAYTSVNHGRIDRRLRTSYGMFVKTVPILSRIDKSMTVKDYIMSFRTELMSTIRHGSYPFTHLCQDLGMTPGISFNFQAIPDMKEYLQLGENRYTASQPDRGDVTDDMSAMIFYTGDNYEIRMESCEAYNSRGILRKVADATKACIENIMQMSLEVPVTDLSVVSRDEESEILALSRGEKMEVDFSRTFVSLFTEQAGKSPQATALVGEDGTYTYAELDRRTNAFARYLRGKGVQDGEFVCVELVASSNFIIAAIGIQKAGAAYVPVDPSYPEERRQYISEDSESRLTVRESTFAEVDWSDDAAIDRAKPESVAYMIYTSGSTGKPKGVMIPHRAKAHFVQFIAKEWHHTEKSRICCHSSVSFDASVEDLYPVLTVGGTLYIVPEAARKDMGMLHDFIIGNGITGGCYTTQLGQMLLQQYPDLPVEYLVVGGEKMTVAPKCSCRLINTYGPTEFTVDATFFEVEPGREYRNIPIGRPLHNLSCYVLDCYGHLLPRGVAGELVISGPQVALGYWKREDLTAEKFVECPYDEGKMYHTGDLVRYNEDGDIEYLGRIDNQVKLRGFRIELGEIETLVAGYEGIGMCSVQVREVGGVQHLCAYYSADREIDKEALREYLSTQLTEYMVPTAYMQLDSMPLTPNGKINTKALPQPEVKVEDVVVPETETEKRLFDIAAELLKHDQFGVTSNLIGMGLTSLSAMRLGVMLQRETGVSVPMSAIFANPTLRNLSEFIDSAAKGTAQSGSTELLDRYPISENQRGVYIDWEMNREAIQYNMPKILKFKSVDAQKLRDAIVAVVNAHPYLKTRLVQADGDVMQLQLNADEVVVTVENLDFEPDTDFFQKRVKPFNLFTDRLYRFEIYKTPSCVYLFQDTHHSVFDGISDVLLMEELNRALSGEQLLGESYTSFDYAVDEQKLLSGESFAKAEEWFDSLVAQTESTVYPHSSEGTDAGGFGKYEFQVESEGIDRFCREAGVTSNAYFATIIAQILHRATREESVLFSTIDNGRTDAGRMQSFGMYVKTLPVRSTLDFAAAGSTSFTEAIGDMHSQLMQTLSFSYYPFTRISERHHIRPEILYVYHGNLATELAVDENVEEILLELDTVKMPLTITVYHKGGNSYTVLLSYNTALYSAVDMKRLASAFRAASLNSLSAGTIARFSMLDTEERSRVESFRSTCKQEIPWKLFYQPIEENAVKYADRTALIAKDRTLTFAEFNREANRVAHALIRRGVKRGDRVVLLLPRRSGVIVSMFGVSKTGAAYIPCDPEYPADRINLILTDSEAQYIITVPELAADYPAERVILIDDIYNNGKSEPGDDDNPNLDVSPEDLAYLIYTSGSTGRPKGVMLRHVGIANYLYDHPSNVHIHGLTELGVKSFVTITTLSFDMSLKEFAGSLFNGITSILADEQEVMDAQLLAALMKRTGAEAINGTCSRLLTYLELNDFCEAAAHCKAVWSGGEKYPMQLLTHLQELGVHIFNTYGPTEITVSSNIADLTKAKKVTVGRPLLNYEEFIVDQFNQELPVGFTGELLIGGPGVARGYNNLPEMTAERFVEYKGIRVYRSGDIARWEDNGEVEIIGRNDGQVKLRGFRVELGEIEGVAAKYEGIRQAVADIKEVGSVQHLCLYYTSDGEIDQDALQAFMAESLTEYMVPTVFMQIEAIPLTPNGKTNKKALPVPTVKLEEIVLPANERESMLLDIMKEHLQVEELGVTTNLVAMGLSSIGAMRLSAKLLQQYDLKVPVKDIIEHPTVREMAALAREEKSVRYKPYEKCPTYPLSEAQRGMLVDCLINADALQYNIACALKYKEIDVERLKRAIVEVCEAHPYIKARIRAEEGDYVQVRNDEEAVVIEEYKLDFEPDRAFMQSQVQPFDVLNEKLYRFKLYQAPAHTYLFIDIHHLISDGSSNYILAREMEKAYNGQTLQREEYTAFDRAIDEEKIMKSERGIEAEQYFDKLIDGTEATVYPHSTDIEEGAIYGELNQTIPSEAILTFCKENSIAPSSFFLTVFHHVLHRITREKSTLVYFISNGRSEVQLENFFGVFVKTMPTVVSDFNGDIAGSVRSVHQQMIDTIAHDYYPFTKMTERYGLKAEILYNYFVDLQTSMSLGSDAVESIGLDWDTAKTPLSVTMTKDAQGNFVSSLEYDARLYNEYDMKALNKAFSAFAVNCVKCEGSLSGVVMATEDELPGMKALALGKEMPFDTLSTFPSIFIDQAAKHPDSIAVVSDEASYTYAQLDGRSNAFANYLIEKGVKRGDFVCVSMQGSADFLSVVIGVEKAGAAYVPVDPEYPEERKQYMQEDCRSGFVVTEELLAEVDWSRNRSINLATPEGIAYMIYTSGSTGKPKGVMIPHKAKAHFVQFIAKEWHHTEKSRICCHSSVSFDASVEDLYPVLTVGGTLYFVPQDARKDMGMLHDFIISNGITGGCYTTQLGQMLLQQYPDLPVEYLVVGGEKMTVAPKCNCRLINTYGPTEFTVDATFFDVEPGREYRNIPIGRALHNQAAYVIDAEGQLMPQGIAGELCMAGVQIAAGYWQREDLTAEKFAACPFAGGKMYHTGDLVRYNGDGQLEYLGRIDSQVKLRGFRIELGEIETLIAGYEGIAMCSVQVRDVGGVQHLCAYLTLNDSGKETDRLAFEVGLREYLASQLTDYMVPTAYVFMDEMPLSPSGKINVKALPQPQIEAEEIVAPETETEKKLFEIAVELLKHDQFGVTSNLIGMGLTSLGAMRLGIMIKQAFDKAVPIRDIMQNPTLRLLADIIDGRTSIGATQIAKVHEIQQYYPLTENQRGVYIDWEMNREALQYNIADVFVFRNQNPEELCAALKKTVDAHPILKARVVQTEGDVALARRDDAEPVVSLFEGTPDKDFFQGRVRPFDLFNDDLYRLEIYWSKENPDKTYLFADFHHIVFDGGSSMVFLDDLQRILRGETIDAETYTAFDRTLDEQEMRQSEIYANAEKYFSGLLSEYEVASYPRSAVSASVEPGLAHETVTVSGKDVSALCKEHSLTENSFFMTVVSQALHRILREDSLLLTSITNGRTTPEMERICGMFVQTLPVVSGLSKESVLDAVKAMQDQFIETQYNSICPYTKLVEKYGIRAEIMYVYQGAFIDDSQTEQETPESGQISLDLDTAKLPILISVYPQGADFVVDLEYDTSLYSGKDMHVFGEAVKTLAEAAACHPDEKMSALALVTSGQKEDLLTLGTAPGLDFDKRLTLVDLLRRQAAASPDEVAVVFRDRQLTYSELDALTDALAVHLHNSGVEPETAVGVMIERSELMAVYPIAIMKAGAAYMPLDSHFPEDRLTFMCEDAGIKLILSDPGLVGKAMPSFYGRVFESTELESLAQVSGNEVASLPKVSPENMFVILYTSGSTGKPKGCMLEHHNIVNFCHWYVDEFDVTAADRAVAYANFGFDAHMMDLYPALSVGARVYVIPEEMRMDMVALNDYMEANGLTIAFLTTQIGYMFATAFENKSLRLLSVGGEKLQPIRKPSYRFYNGYGPTECTLYSTSYNIEKDYDSSLIGRPLAGYQLRIVDKCLQMVPQGVAGELVVIGAGVGRGYLNRPDINADKFITLEGKRAYRTGDLVRWSPDGNIEYLGRIDNQVKMRGLRIELGEIESRAMTYKGISQAVVLVKKINGAEHLCLYYTASGDTDETALRQYLTEVLAEYMVPDTFTRMDVMPMTPNGKINRKALPMPVIKAEEIIAPEGDIEQGIFDIVAELLKHDGFGVTTNLLSMGLTSLLAMRLSVMIRQRMNMNIPTQVIFAHPTIREMICAGDQETESPSAQTYDKRAYYPITENQRGLYIDWELNSDTTQYNIPEIQKKEGITADQLRSALIAVVNAHPHLKTRISIQDGDAVQLRNDDEPVCVNMVNMISEPTPAYFESLVRPFNLLNENLYRFEIIQSPTSLFLFRDFHHIIFDGGSNLLFEIELQKALDGETLVPETYTAFDRALDEQEMMKSENCAEADAWFDNLLSGGEAILYPKSAEPEEKSPLAGRVSISCERKNIDLFCTNNNVTGSNYFLTAFLQVLHRLTREENIIITTINNGRSSAEMMNITGMFVKTMPVASNYDFQSMLKTDFAELAGKTQMQMNETFTRDFYPLTRMVERHSIRPNIMFEYQVGVGLEEELEIAGNEGVAELNNNTPKIPLTLGVYAESADTLRLGIEYDASIYNAKDMLVILKAMKEMCEKAAVCEGNEFATISLVPDDEKMELVARSAGPRMDIDFSKTYMDHFLERASICPDSLAVADDNSSVTYAQLNSYSDLIAARLIELGVRKHDFIGVMIERSKEFPVCVFGIHKAGAAYLPLDIEYPNERLQYMLEDSGANVLITTHNVLDEKRKEGEFNADTIIYLDEIDWEKESASVEPVNRCTPDCYTYIIYTSGSTGKPKGVVLHHKGLLNYIFSTIDELHLTAEDRISSHRSFSFDSHIEDLYAILLLGGSLHIMPEKIRKDLQAIRDFVVEHEITGGGYTTSIATMLVNTFDMPVRYISAIGEKLMGVVSRDAQIVNAYGPTECTDHITIHYLEKDKVYKDIPIGHVIANSWCFIVDSAGQLAPMGACGELCIAGIQVGIGYWHLPERTEQSFVECPFVGHNIDGTPVRMYHTGDLARFNDQGELECLGRIDNQVKLRGYRVELGEIETEAMKVDGVQQSVAMIREINGDKHLVLYYTVDDGKSVEEDVLDDFMKQSKLPAYMVPEVYMQMDAMPRTPNGKINRRALPVPEMSVGEIELPANESEARLFEIAKKVLKTENFGVTTNLMNVGMNSLSAMRLSASIQQELGINVPTRSIMQSPTVREIVGLSLYPEELETDIAIVHAPRDYYPVSENQRGIYVEWELNRNTTQYNVPLVQKMDGIDAETLRDALVVVVEAHPYLKNRFAMHDDDIVQVRNESEPAAVTFTEIEMEPDRSFFQQKVKPFDLLSDRLYRIEVVKTPSSVYLFADVHHTIFDGGSQFIFMSELEKVLSGETLEKETYTAWDRALDEQEMMRSGKFEDARNYFDRTLREAEIASYPHSSGVKESGNRACILNTRINAAGITEFCRKNGITENSFFMSVTSIVLQRLTREDKLIFTSICNGRTNVRMQSIMGMFVKTLPVVSVEAQGTFAEYADRIQQQFIRTQEYGGIYPYTHLVSRFPANPEIMFAYQGGIGGSDGDSSDDTTVALDTAKMPLTISVYPSGGDFVVSLEYSSDFYVSEDMERLASVFSLVAGQACDNSLNVEDYRLVSDSEMKSLARLGKGRTLKYDTEDTLVSIMRRQAQAVPDNTLVVFRDRSYTYRQIDEQTDRIASHLVGMGVTHEQAIGVMIERSELMFIYSMAIMKAGCSYMPLDPHFPEERLMFMCEDAGVSIILSDQGLARKVMPSFSGKVLYRNDFDNVKKNVASWPEVKADDRMVILYTSGSTGKPKGVELEQHGIVNFCHWYVKEFGMTGKDRAVGYANYGFDAHMIDIYPTMLAGASVYIFPEEMRLDLNAMNDYIEQNHLTVAFMTTQIGCQIATMFENKSLRVLNTGGEKMPSITPPAYRLYNVYGPTECSLFSTFYNVKSYFEGEFIGHALDNYQLYIVDKCLQPVPEGVPGELLICGTGVARGYLNRPDLNREKFINFRGKKAYRSGDLVRWAVDPRDGSKQIEFLGRIDKQVKLRGLRIELGEIENKVVLYPGIKQVCVDVKEIGGGQNLVCYYVTRNDRDIIVTDLKKKLGEELTSFMIPELFVKLEEMPLTPNGKVNRKALPVPQVTEALCVPPESEKEQVLFDIVKETVGNDNFGVTDDLRHLGMTSLMAIKVVAKANRVGITLKVDELLKSPTIRGVLNLRQTFVYWYNYDDNKPIIVLTQGETAFNHLQSYLKALSEHFAILVVESIKSHADKIFGGGEDYEDVINMYFDMIDFNMLDANRPITAFTGHCFGGDLCYRLASRWHQEFPEQKPAVCLLDSFWLDCNREVETVEVDDSILPDNIIAAKNFFIGEVNKTMEMYRSLNFHGAPDKYDGEVCLFRAMLPEPHVKALADKIGTSEKELEDKYGMTDSLLQKVLLPIRAFDNEAYWRTYLPEIQCCHVEADHLSMLEDKFVDQYVEWVVKHIIS